MSSTFLDGDWLNDEVRRIDVLPHHPDKAAEVLFDSPYLLVTAASARRMLAMKIRAGRARDRSDIKLLLRQLGVTTMEKVREIHGAVYPHDAIPWRSQARVEAVLQAVQEERLREELDCSPAEECRLDSTR